MQMMLWKNPFYHMSRKGWDFLKRIDRLLVKLDSYQLLTISVVKSPSPKKNQGTDDGSDSDGDEGAYCNICMEPWTNSGAHRISSLRFLKISFKYFIPLTTLQGDRLVTGLG